MKSVEPGGQSLLLLPSHEPSAALIQPSSSFSLHSGALPALCLPYERGICQSAVPVVSSTTRLWNGTAAGLLSVSSAGFASLAAVAAVVDAYEAARHPEVLAGARTTEAALREFLDTFEVGGDVSGRASRREFHEYYANVSAAVEDDAAFETLVRNAWGLQEAPGRAAVHALVTHRDGRQSVEVLSDSGEDALDALRARGVDAIDVKLQGAATKNTRTFRSTLVLE